jgi:hypothetical protein
MVAPATANAQSPQVHAAIAIEWDEQRVQAMNIGGLSKARFEFCKNAANCTA